MFLQLGKDSFGDEHFKTLKSEGVDTSHVTLTDQALTGVGQLTVLPNGQNRIVTVSGSNAHLSVSDIEAAEHMISSAKVMLCENQIEHETALTALRLANKVGGDIISNLFTISKVIPSYFIDLLCSFDGSECGTCL